MKLQPSKPRCTILDRSDGLHIVIPVQRDWFIILFLSLSIAVWIFLTSLVFLFSESAKGGLWFGLYSLFGIWLGYPLLWTVEKRFVFLLPAS